MTETLKGYMDRINVTVNVPLQLPKLKKIGEKLPINLPKLNLPKLKKV